MFGCLVLLLVVVPAHTASQCAPVVEKRTLLRPRASVAQDGVEYLGFSKQPSLDYCHRGCCSVAKCDTSFYTGHTLDENGHNCFYFECHGKCVTATVGGTSGDNFSVAKSSPTSTQELPEFPSFISPPPNNETALLDTSTNNTSLHIEEEKVQKSSTSVIKTTVETVEEKKETPVKEHIVSPTSGGDKEENEVKVLKQKATAKPLDKVVEISTEETKPEETHQEEKEKEVTKVEEEEEKVAFIKEGNVAKQEKDTTTIITEVESTKETKKDDSPVKTEETPAPPPVVEVVDETDEEVVAPKPAVVGNTTVNDNTLTLLLPSNTKENIKPEEIVHIDSSVIIESGDDEDGSWRDVVLFWGGVTVGSLLVLVGLLGIVKMYRRRGRRLYASLTDDYLINGMYSI